MADSDDEYDNSSSSRRRGKFRKEREDYNGNNEYGHEQKNRERSINDRDGSSRYHRGYQNYKRDRSPIMQNRGFSPRRPVNNYQYQSYPNRNMSPESRHYPSLKNYRDPYASRLSSDYESSNKRPFSPPGLNYKLHSGPNFNSQNVQHLDRPRSPYYNQENIQKKQRRDWSALDSIPRTTNYFEHDNRSGSEFTEYQVDRFHDDYHRIEKPGYNASFRYDRYEHEPSNLYSHQMMKNYGPPHSNLEFFNSSSPYMPNNNPRAPMMNNFSSMNNFSPGPRPGMDIMNNFNSNNHYMGGFNGNQFGNRLNNDMHHHSNNQGLDGIGQTQPQMLSFKHFLSNLNSEIDSDPSAKSISPEIATKKYNEYKNDFRREQIAEFFSTHKHENWFMLRYHPEVSAKRKDEQREAIFRRLQIFFDLLERFNGTGDKLSLDMTEQSAQTNLNKFLDACMIRLEDGTDADLKILEKIYNPSSPDLNLDKGEIKTQENNQPDENLVNENLNENQSDNESGVETNSENESDNGEHNESSKFDRRKKGKKLKNPKNSEEVNVEKANIEKNYDEKLSKQLNDVNVETQKTNESSNSKPNLNPSSIPQKTQSIFFKHLPVNVTRQDLEQIGSRYEGFKRASVSEPAPERRFQRRGWITFDSTVNIREICTKINGVKLHEMILNATINRELDQKVKCIIGLTNHDSIVHNDLKLITKVVDNMDKRWGLWQFTNSYSNNKLNDEDFKTDSDLRRLKNKKSEQESEASKPDGSVDVNESANGNCITSSNENETNETKINHLVKSANEYLKELSENTNPDEASKETEIRKSQDKCKTGLADEIESSTEKSTESEKSEDKGSKSTGASRNIVLKRDKKAAYLLDNLILYLRIVHSIDFYNATEYQQEDWMPNRCGVLHVRGSTEHKSSYNSNIVNILSGVNINYFDPSSIKKVQLEEWMRLFEANIKPYYDYRDKIDTEIAKRLGLKDLQNEIAKYITLNTQKIETDIWLCSISGKKFKGPEYVKKHIETKHRHKLIELRNDVEYFNRFVYDPKRPYLPEHPLTKNMGQANHNNNSNIIQNFGYSDNQAKYNYHNMNQSYPSGPQQFNSQQQRFNDSRQHNYMQSNNSYMYDDYQGYRSGYSMMSGQHGSMANQSCYQGINGFRHCSHNNLPISSHHVVDNRSIRRY